MHWKENSVYYLGNSNFSKCNYCGYGNFPHKKRSIAKNNQIGALVSYNNAITNLWQATGELLDRQGVHLDESEVNRLYKAMP